MALDARLCFLGWEMDVSLFLIAGTKLELLMSFRIVE